MSPHRPILVGTCLALVAGGCRTKAPPALERELQMRGARYDAALANPAAAGPLARWVLPRHLNEVSGLALMPDGRLLAHDDEHGRVTVIDPRRGVVLSEFALAGRKARADFEGITVMDSRIVMVTSRGRIVTFREGANGSTVPFTEVDTRLGGRCEVEGIAFDPERAQLLMPCKRVDGEHRGEVVIHRVDVPLVPGAPTVVQVIPLDPMHAAPGTALHPTDITRDPATGNFVLVAAPERALVELSPTGTVLRTGSLPAGHVQAEGIAVTPDRALILADEARSGSATLTVYRWPLAGMSPSP